MKIGKPREKTERSPRGKYAELHRRILECPRDLELPITEISEKEAIAIVSGLYNGSGTKLRKKLAQEGYQLRTHKSRDVFDGLTLSIGFIDLNAYTA